MLQHVDQRNHGILVNINGELLPRDRAGVSPFDSVVQGGDAVWEGLRLYNGRIFRLTEVYRADEMFCTGTMGELAAVTTVDGRTIGEGDVGPMTATLSDLFAELTAREGTAL